MTVSLAVVGENPLHDTLARHLDAAQTLLVGLRGRLISRDGGVLGRHGLCASGQQSDEQDKYEH